MSAIKPTACAGCGGPLPERKRTQARHPKWCSERCRKASYGDPCIDCGAKTRFGAERARVAEPRCSACAAKLVGLHRTDWEKRERLAALYRAGVPLADIARELGVARNGLGERLRALRAAGYDLPYRYGACTERAKAA